MKQKADRALAEKVASEVLEKHAIKSLPVDPFAIAEAKGISVKAAPSASRGVSGMLLRHGNAFGIMYGTHVKSEGFRRFSVAHELGHYYLPGHIDAVLGTDSVHQSRAGYATDDPYEAEADHFAAALLMPNPYFKTALIKSDDGLPVVETLASLCGTSLVAAAIRYIEHASIPAAAVLSDGMHVDFCFMSTALRDFRGLEWLRKGSIVPTTSSTHRFNQEAANVLEASRLSEPTTLRDWFGSKRSVEALEEVVGLGGYGKTLTIITTETDEDDDEESLEESWTPRFARGR